MKKYTANVIYTEETVRLLDSTLQRTFLYWRRYIVFALCIVSLFTGFRIGIENGVGLLLLIIGCLLAPYAANYTFPSAACRASLEFMKNKRFLMEYTFNSNGFICIVGKNETVYEYDKIIRLIDHKDQLYLCTSLQQACMIEKKSLKPNDLNGFKTFISERVGLKWTVQPTVFNLNFKTIKYNRENTRFNNK